MGTQVRTGANDVRRMMRPLRLSQPAGSVDGAEGETQELVGAMFSTAKELRHLAEQEYGELFVPVEVLVETSNSAVLRLRPEATGPIVVHAERRRHWHPYRVSRVERARNEGRPVADSSEEPAPPRTYRQPGRPRIDWL